MTEKCAEPDGNDRTVTGLLVLISSCDTIRAERERPEPGNVCDFDGTVCHAVAPEVFRRTAGDCAVVTHERLRRRLSIPGDAGGEHVPENLDSELAEPLIAHVAEIERVARAMEDYYHHEAPGDGGREKDVQATLVSPEQVRQSRTDKSVFLFYRSEEPGRWICSVVKRVDNDDAFLITAYPTDAIKEGETIWTL